MYSFPPTPDEDSLFGDPLRVPPELPVHHPAARGAGPRDPSPRRAARRHRRPEDGGHRSPPTIPPSPSNSFRRAAIASGTRSRPASGRRWTTGAISTRAGIDAPKLRGARADQAPAFAVVARRACRCVGTRAGLAVLRRLFRAIERVLPPPDEVAEVFRRIDPDVLLSDAAAVLPLAPGGPRPLCARSSGIKSVLGVGSWDHLTTKGLIHEVPGSRAGLERGAETGSDRAARRARRIASSSPGRRPTTTGSPPRRPLDREAFCRQARPRPGAPDPAVSLLVAIHRAARGRVRAPLDRRRFAAMPTRGCGSAGVLVRPHPQNAGSGSDVDLARRVRERGGSGRRPGVNPIGGVGARRLLRLDVPRRSASSASTPAP